MARPKSEGETKTHQQHLLMAPSEIRAIDDWSFAHRIRSRGEAIRRLCQMGLAIGDREPELNAIIQVLLETMGDADKKLEALKGSNEGDFNSRLSDYIDAVSDFMGVSGSLLIDVAHLQRMSRLAISTDEIENIVKVGIKTRSDMRGKIYYDGEYKKARDEKE